MTAQLSLHMPFLGFQVAAKLLNYSPELTRELSTINFVAENL